MVKPMLVAYNDRARVRNIRDDERALIVAWETVMRENPYALYAATEDNRLDVYGAKALIQTLGYMGWGVKYDQPRKRE